MPHYRHSFKKKAKKNFCYLMYFKNFFSISYHGCCADPGGIGEHVPQRLG